MRKATKMLPTTCFEISMTIDNETTAKPGNISCFLGFVKVTSFFLAMEDKGSGNNPALTDPNPKNKVA